MRALFAGLACILVASTTLAADQPSEKSYTVSAIGMGDGYRYASKEEGKDGTAFTIRQKGDRLRVDITAGAHHGTAWRDAKGSWLVANDQPVALPLSGKAMPKPIVYDVDAPCREMSATCSRVEPRQLLGHRAAGWEFRHAGGRGPDGTDNGTMWIDEDTGVLLEMRGDDVGNRHYEWHALQVSYEDVPDGLFDLPDGVGKVGPMKPGTKVR
jgi:hypothetical protein